MIHDQQITPVHPLQLKTQLDVDLAIKGQAWPTDYATLCSHYAMLLWGGGGQGEA